MKFFTDRSGPQDGCLPIIVLVVSICIACVIGQTVSDAAGAISFFVVWPLLIFIAMSAENAESAPRVSRPEPVVSQPVYNEPIPTKPREPTFNDFQAEIDQRHNENVKLILSSTALSPDEKKELIDVEHEQRKLRLRQLMEKNLK